MTSLYGWAVQSKLHTVRESCSPRASFSLRHALLEHPDQNHSGSPGRETQLSLSVTWIQSTGKRRPSALYGSVAPSVHMVHPMSRDGRHEYRLVKPGEAHSFSSVQNTPVQRFLYMIGAIVKRRMSANLTVFRPERPCVVLR